MTDERDTGQAARPGAATADETATTDASAGDTATRRATVTTTHGDGATAEQVAAALEPDNTAEMATRTDGDSVVTTVRRDSTGGLQSTVDDYVVNATVADRLATDDGDGAGRTARDGDATTGSDAPADAQTTEHSDDVDATDSDDSDSDNSDTTPT